MNSLTQVRNTQRISRQEVLDGTSEKASWHDQYKHSAYVYAGGLPFSLTEGDVLAVFSQYGEIVDVNLPKDKETGKSRGFAFLCYEDQRSTVLCVDNLNGAKVAGRIIRVEHVDDYRQKKKELDVDQDGEDGGDAAEDGGLDAHPRDSGERTAAATDRVGETSHRGPAAIANPGGGPFPWESKDSVFSILREARRDVYGEDDQGGGAGPQARERRRERSGEEDRRGKERHKRRKHKHRHRRE